jgi:hypothetical protein
LAVGEDFLAVIFARAVATDLGFGGAAAFLAGAATGRRFAVKRMSPRSWYAGFGS